MKKGIFIAAGVVALLAVMVWADHKFPAAGAGSASAPAKPTDAPTISLKDLNDKDVTLQQYKGEVVLVNFWATWCALQSGNPLDDRISEKVQPARLHHPGSFHGRRRQKAIEPFLEKERFDVNGQKEAMSYPILLGNDAIAEKFGGILGLPTSMLFSRDGKKVRTIVGLVNHDDISKAIESLL